MQNFLNFLLLVVLCKFASAEDKEFNVNLQDPNWQNPQLGGDPKNAALQIFLTSPGLSYINRVAGDLLNDQMPKKLPNYRRNFKHGYVKTVNMKITDFSPLKFGYSVNSPHTINWGSSGGRISIHGDWKGRRKFFSFLFGGIWKKFSGSFEMVVRNLDVKIGTNFVKSQDGLPQLSRVECHSKFGDLDLNIKGGFWGFLINLFSGRVEKWLQPILERELCGAAKNFLKNDMNRKLRTFPTSVNLSPNFVLNYALISDPKMAANSIVSDHKGEISYKGNGGTSFFPQNLSKSAENGDFMVKISLGDYVLNSFLSHAHKNNFCAYSITKKTFPPAENFLQTTCNLGSVCIGTIFKELGQLYPDSECEIRVESYNEPTAILKDGKASLQGLGRLRLMVNDQKSQNTTEVIIIDFNIHADMQISLIEDRKMAGKIKINQILWTLSEAQIEGGEAFQLDIQELVDITTPLLEELANERLGRGLPIPMIDGVNLENSKLIILNRTAELFTDLKYTGNYDLSQVLNFQ